MIDLIIIGIGAIAGIILGLRFKILILVPAILLATAAITVTGIVSGNEAKPVALTVFEPRLRFRSDILQAAFLMSWFLRSCRHGRQHATAAPGRNRLRALSLARRSLARSSARPVPP
jgi:hypothetical protein